MSCLSWTEVDESASRAPGSLWTYLVCRAADGKVYLTRYSECDGTDANTGASAAVYHSVEVSNVLHGKLLAAAFEEGVASDPHPSWTSLRYRKNPGYANQVSGTGEVYYSSERYPGGAA